MSLTDPSGQPLPMQPGEFASASHPSEITFGFKQLSPASFMYVRPEESIRINVTNSAAGVTSVVFAWRTMLTDGSLHVGIQNFSVTADSTQNTFLVPLHEGFLMSVRIGTVQANQRGQTFARVEIVRGASAPQSQSAILLCQGYMGQGWVLGYPGGRQDASVDGPGAIISQQQANPAAGADWVYTVPASHRQRLQSLHAIFTTSATVANRQPELIVDDGVNNLWITGISANIPASLSNDISSTGTNAPTGANAQIFAMVSPPGLVLNAGFRIRSLTTAIQAGDQWGAIFLLLEDWLAI